MPPLYKVVSIYHFSTIKHIVLELSSTYISSIEKGISYKFFLNSSEQSYNVRMNSSCFHDTMVASALTVGLTGMGHQTSSLVERFRQVMLKPFLKAIALKDM